MARKETAPLDFHRQRRVLKIQYPDEICLYRLGDFFQAFDEDAEIVSVVLGIPMVGRHTVGFVYGEAGDAISKLVAAGHRVLVAERVGRSPDVVVE